MGILRTNASGGGRILELENRLASIQTQASNLSLAALAPLSVMADAIYSSSNGTTYGITFAGTFDNTNEFITNELANNFRVITFKKDCFMRLKFPEYIRCTAVTYRASGTFKITCQNDVLANLPVSSSNSGGSVTIPEQVRNMSKGDTIRIGIEYFNISGTSRVTFSTDAKGSMLLADRIV